MEIGAGFLHRHNEECYPQEKEGDDGADLQERIDARVVGVGVCRVDGLSRITPVCEPCIQLIDNII